MGAARTCVILLIVVQFQVITSQSFFGSLFCDFLCDDNDSSDYCDDCSSEETTKPSRIRNSSFPLTLSQNISIKIPASQGTILDILNVNGLWSVNVDAQGNSGASSPPAAATTPAASGAAASTTEATSTTAAAKRK